MHMVCGYQSIGTNAYASSGTGSFDQILHSLSKSLIENHQVSYCEKKAGGSK